MKARQNQKNDILEQINTNLAPQFAQEQQSILKDFIKGLYRDVAISDMARMSEVDLVGLTVSLWRHVQNWDRQQAHINVFNPDVEQDDWQSTHTVIAILGKNIPFVIDTVRLVLLDLKIKTHTVFYSELPIHRDDKHQLVDFKNGDETELLLYFEIDQTTSSDERDMIAERLRSILVDVDSVVGDFKAVQERLQNTIVQLIELPQLVAEEESEEERTFLQWLAINHFTFLGCDEFVVEKNKTKLVPKSQLGIMKREDFELNEHLASYKELSKADSSLYFAKASQRAMVHRPAYPDVVYVKRFDDQGKLVGGVRFIGLYTSVVYNGSPVNVPIVRKKVEQVLALSEFASGSHYYKELSQVLNTYPMEDLLLSSVNELLKNTLDIVHVQERKQLKLFVRNESENQFVVALVLVPRDIFNTELRLKFEDLLRRTINASDSDFQTYLSESHLARVRFVFKLNAPLEQELEVDALQARMKQMARRWVDELQETMVEHFGEERGIELLHKYQQSFPSGYRDVFGSRVAVADIERIESLYKDDSTSMALSFYRSIEANNSELKLKLFHQDGELLLSDLIPVLENLGLKVADEYPYEINPIGEQNFWIYDFTLRYEPNLEFDPQNYKAAFADTFLAVWYGAAENDAFNKLVLGAGIRWRDVAMLRAYAHYIKQIRFGFGQGYIAETLLNHAGIVKDLVDLFANRFHPDYAISIDAQQKRIEAIERSLEDVSNLNEDRIMRKYVELIMATLRTNYYQTQDGKDADYISFKFDHSKISEIPLPRLAVEIFVYSPRVEGVHLRGGKVARGGLRWSDRMEDFRTEVLGLVKAQQVKNSVIVPVGAKGGFVAKFLSQTKSREEFMAEGIACYRKFVSGLLDITDNLVEGAVVPPKEVVRYDGDDPYLVVAADKGTATFSDIANELAVNKGFWLGDAFASGGSNGYDHKKMGITARGAWVSVQRHFRELGIDVQTQPITVIGIGDMAGDVFGNGLLSSKCMQLVAAFNHLHIFVDPYPTDNEKAFAERQRLFTTPGTAWSDYDAKLISKGGGIFNRSAKSIKLTPEMKKRFEIDSDVVTPTELISIILKAQVDLLWNGGIGTYVKSTTQSHGDVGDKANDALRINAKELRCRVIGEGGNLGMTQAARIEYGLAGGMCFTDAIDNAGGVNCSDLEVNIKILLDDLVARGDLTVKQRNAWLEKMTNEVADIVLGNNYRQAQAISIAYLEGFKRFDEYRRLVADFEARGKLNRALEVIPTEDIMSERKTAHLGLTRSEMAVLISYGKNEMKEALAAHKIAKDSYLLNEADALFPPALVSKYRKDVHAHRLVNEIVATKITNDMFNSMGITFVHRMMQSTGCSYVQLAQAWVAARDIFGFKDLLAQIEALDHKVPSLLQSDVILKLIRMMRHATRWIIKNNRNVTKTEVLVSTYHKKLASMSGKIETFMVGDSVATWQKAFDVLVEQGVPESLARIVAANDQIYSLLAIIAVANQVKTDVESVAQGYFMIGERLKLAAVANQMNVLNVSSHWQSLAREAMRDDFEWQQRRITLGMLQNGDAKQSLDDRYESWRGANKTLVNRWFKMAKDILSANEPEFSMYSVATRELLDLSQASSSNE